MDGDLEELDFDALSNRKNKSISSNTYGNIVGGGNLKNKSETKAKAKTKTKKASPKPIKNLVGKQDLLMVILTKFFCKSENIDKILSILSGKSDISLRIIDWFVTNYAKKNNTSYSLSYYAQTSSANNFSSKTKGSRRKSRSPLTKKNSISGGSNTSFPISTIPFNKANTSHDIDLNVNSNSNVNINQESNVEGENNNVLIIGGGSDVSSSSSVTPSNCNYANFNDQFIVYLDYKCKLKAYSKKSFDPFCRRDRISFYYNETDSIITTVGQLNFFRWAIENYILDYIQEHLDQIEEDMNNNIRKIYCKSKKNKTVGRGKKKTQFADGINTTSNTNTNKSIEMNTSGGGKNVNFSKLSGTGYVSPIKSGKEYSPRKKRKELSESAIKNINKHHQAATVYFD
mgnify:CR=1 FL=1